ncbi:hypothetical protein Salat_1870800 [Sesamum alatum]|uniref:F-box domain-containing protein n=1 Tax=Sesamum alatum TaxID=300844 RepID=A0AAE2CI06_9LAMI|nr:hypothetical protein Salat_1870800 [Sesamum alatum]
MPFHLYRYLRLSRLCRSRLRRSGLRRSRPGPRPRPRPRPRRYSKPVHFPSDLIGEVCSWLPIHAVLKFQSVNKHWNTTLRDPHFAYLHYERAYGNLPYNTIAVEYFSYPAVNSSRISIQQNSPWSTPSCSFLDGTTLNLLGSIRGFIAVRKDYLYLHEVSFSKILLYNPVTRYGSQFYLYEDQRSLGLLAWGLGYDWRNGDFVVVWIEYISPWKDSPPRNPAGQVYRTGTLAWQNIITSNDINPAARTLGAFVGDWIYWLNSDNTGLVRFTIHSGELSAIPLPLPTIEDILFELR